MRKPKRDEYADALNQLAAMKAAGQVTEAEYDLKRARLLAEATRSPMTAGRIVWTIIGVLIVLFIALRILGAVSNAITGN